MFFDWFYPAYLGPVVEGTLNAFLQDDEVVYVCLELLTELVLNRNNRVRFDTWNINGLIIFKETSKYVVKLLQFWDVLKQKACSSDEYTQKWRFVKQICILYNNVIVGSYINFAICEYYNDDVFTQLSTLVLQMVGCLDVSKLRQYSKVELNVYKMLWSFFSSHMELVFMKFDTSLITSLI